MAKEIKTGDTVKIIGKTLDGENREREYIPIGTICKVLETEIDSNTGKLICLVRKLNTNWEYWYLADDLEKGKLVWRKEV